MPPKKEDTFPLAAVIDVSRFLSLGLGGDCVLAAFSCVDVVVG